MGKKYCGQNSGPGPQKVIVYRADGKVYDLHHLCKHSPDGFQWGYGGSGPADLARSMLYDCLGRESEELKRIIELLYQDFKWDFIAKAGPNLEIVEEDIRAWIDNRISDLKSQRKIL